MRDTLHLLIPGYLSPFPPQITWLDRNFPYWRNFQRLQISWIIGPHNLMRLIENPDLCRAYGSKAQSIARARFDLTRVGDELKKAIQSRLK